MSIQELNEAQILKVYGGGDDPKPAPTPNPEKTSDDPNLWQKMENALTPQGLYSIIAGIVGLVAYGSLVGYRTYKEKLENIAYDNKYNPFNGKFTTVQTYVEDIHHETGIDSDGNDDGYSSPSRSTSPDPNEEDALGLGLKADFISAQRPTNQTMQKSHSEPNLQALNSSQGGGSRMHSNSFPSFETPAQKGAFENVFAPKPVGKV